ncbi:MAG: hypothetical protein Q9191_003197 [Dirinaria sp. TL-2023a]
MQKLGCKTYQCDLASTSSIRAFADSFGNRQLDVLLNIAGVMAPPEQDGLPTVSQPTLSETFSTNTFGPLLLTQALLHCLLQSPSPRIGLMSSRVGSIADNSSGGSYAYRASKAALNSVGKSMAVDLQEKGVVVVLMHPGFVKTALDTSGKTHKLKEAVEPEEAAVKLWAVFASKSIVDTGKFWHREGQELPW